MKRYYLGAVAIVALVLTCGVLATTARAATHNTTQVCVDSATVTLVEPLRSDYPNTFAGSIQYGIAEFAYNTQINFLNHASQNGGYNDLGHFEWQNGHLVYVPGTHHTVSMGACATPTAWTAGVSTDALCYSKFQDVPGYWLAPQAADLFAQGYWQPYATSVPNAAPLGNSGLYEHCNLSGTQHTTGAVVDVNGNPSNSDLLGNLGVLEVAE